MGGAKSAPLPGVPVPFGPAVCGLSGALSLTLNGPALVPTAVGANVTLMLHLASMSRVAPQVVLDT